MEFPKGNYLFVCASNQSRSPYAAWWFEENYGGRKIKADSSGLSAEIFNNVQFRESNIEWANYIFVMEEWMKQEILRGYKDTIKKCDFSEKNIFNLDIPNNFGKSYSNPPNFDKFTSEEAVKWLEINNGDHELEIGTNMFEKILQGKLEKIFK